ncbi:MAG: hypothetical protein J5U17_13245 [Candidatus Methanoperedens sp.]|nr:hypothetical protein [Candidatus Methanoperedens sp.]MCE8429610.1 hypothetical protein [Candidatus Methanoperedens sp.]
MEIRKNVGSPLYVLKRPLLPHPSKTHPSPQLILAGAGWQDHDHQSQEHDWINEREEKKIGKGRPYKIYSLKVGFNDIITQIETERKKADVEAQEKIERLKKLGKSHR